MRDVGEVACKVTDIVELRCLCPDVGEILCRVYSLTAQCNVSIFQHVLVVADKEIEACCVGIGCLLVEVVLRHVVVAVVNQWQSLLKILLALCIHISKCAAVILHKHLCLRLGDIGYTLDCLAQFRSAVCLAEDVGKNEVSVAANQQSLALHCLQFRVIALSFLFNLLHALKHCICAGY